MSALVKKLVVISGYPKSGTTLLQALLDHHPDLVVLPEEFKLLKRHLAKGFDVREAMLCTVEDFRSGMQSSTRHEGHTNRRYDLALDAFERCVRQCETRDPREAMCALLSCYAKALPQKVHSSAIFVIKEPYSYKQYYHYKRWFGDRLVWIHLRRNRADNYASIVNKWNPRVWTPRKFLIGHVLSEYILRELMRRIPSARLVAYEDLVRQPRETMELIARDIGIAFDEILLQPTFHGYAWEGNSSYRKKFAAVSTASLGKGGNLREPTFTERLIARKEYFVWKFARLFPRIHAVLARTWIEFMKLLRRTHFFGKTRTR